MVCRLAFRRTKSMASHRKIRMPGVLSSSACSAGLPVNIQLERNTHKTFENLLEDFPVSRILQFELDGSQRYGTDYIAREQYIQEQQEKNIFIGAIQRKAEKTKVEGWELEHFGTRP